MPGIKIPGNLDPKGFFMEFLPETFGNTVACADLSGYEGISISVGFDLEDSGSYSVTIEDGRRIRVTEGRKEGELLTIEMSGETFIDGIAGRYSDLPVENFLTDPVGLLAGVPPEEVRKKIEIIRSIHGMMEVEAKNGSEVVEMKVKFNDNSDPACKFSGDIKVLTDMMMGDANPVQGFMTGQYKITGSLPFAMSLQQVFPS